MWLAKKWSRAGLECRARESGCVSGGTRWGLTAVCNSCAYFFIRRRRTTRPPNIVVHVVNRPDQLEYTTPPPPLSPFRSTLSPAHSHTPACTYTCICSQDPKPFARSYFGRCSSGGILPRYLQAAIELTCTPLSLSHLPLLCLPAIATPMLSLVRWFYVNLHNFWVMSIDF